MRHKQAETARSIKSRNSILSTVILGKMIPVCVSHVVVLNVGWLY